MPKSALPMEKHAEWSTGKSKKEYEALRVDQYPCYAAVADNNHMRSKVAKDAIAKDLQQRPSLTYSNICWLNYKISNTRPHCGCKLTSCEQLKKRP